MLIPSLPPVLKPSMIRPRAGQRNSGVEPEASAWSAVAGSFALAAFGSTLPVGVLSMPVFLPCRRGGGLRLGDDGLRRRRTRPCPLRPCPSSFGDLLVRLVRTLSPLFSAAFAFSLGLVLDLLRLRHRPSFEATSERFLPSRSRGRLPGGVRDGAAAAGAVDRNHDMHAALDLRRARQPVGASGAPRRARRSGATACRACRSGDHDRRSAARRPSGRRTADRLRGGAVAAGSGRQRRAGDGRRRRERRGRDMLRQAPPWRASRSPSAS